MPIFSLKSIALGGVLGAVLMAGAVEPAASAMPTLSAPAPCAWYGESDQRDGNIGAPDLDAYYFANVMPVSTGERIQIRGAYPFARYFSFHVYNPQTLLAVATVYDRQIGADRGSSNPFRRGRTQGSGDTYTEYVVFTARPKRPAPNTMYVDPSELGPSALLVYRIYVPTDPTDPSGGVPFPTVNIQSSDGRTTVLSQPGCATTPPPGGSEVFKAFANSNYPSDLPAQNVPAAKPLPVWQRAFGSKLGNKQNAYLWTTISRQYGPLVVIHSRAPTFPNNRAGVPVYVRRQVRYWSFCTYDAQGEAGYGCAADYAASIRDGYITYVVSDPGARPAHATAKYGVTWLPWGGNQYSAQIVERNMLPSSGFAHAVEDITQHGRGSNARQVMGSYYPTAVYCTTKLFEQGGWWACFRHAHRPT